MIFLLPLRTICKFGRYSILFILTVVVIFTARPAEATINSVRQLKAEKVVVLIIDDLGIVDINNTKLKNINKTARSSAVGLMNTRTKSYNSRNRQSAYLTIGMGTRVVVPQYIGNMTNLTDNLRIQYPDHVPGKIGETANKTGKKIALLGNSDTGSGQNYARLAAMDSSGYVDTIYTGSDLLMGNPANKLVSSTNSKRLLNLFIRVLPDNDIIFVDYGDTTRVAEARDTSGLKGDVLVKMRNQAMERADAFLGEIVKLIENENAVLLVVSPTSPADNNLTGIKNLAPVFLYKKGEVKGILTSNSTRREGLISNIDIAPGIFAFLDIDTKKMQFTGEKITVIADVNPLTTVNKNFYMYSGLKKLRYLVHGVYVLLMLLVIYFIFIPVIRKRQQGRERFSRAISVGIIAVPVLSSVTAVILQDTVVSGVSFLILLLLTGYLFSINIKTTMAGMAAMSCATSVFLIYDLLSGSGYLVNTPLGFNDVFTGGRYYGINNDSMGILLGSTVFGLFFFLEKFVPGGIRQIIVTAGAMLLVVLSQTPGFGANVGGTMAAITTGILACIILPSGRRPAMKTLLVAVLTALTAELAFSLLEISSVNQTHAGKTAAKLLTDNVTGHLLEILSSKLSVFLVMLALPPWNVIFFLQLYFYRAILTGNKREIKNIENNSPLSFKSFQVIFYGAGAAFIFNDTGIIAAAMMLIYLTVPLGMLLVREGCNISEYSQAITQRI